MANPPPPAGWYPHGQALRWWDGSQWTEHIQPLPKPGVIGSAMLAEPVLQFVHTGSMFARDYSILSQSDMQVGRVAGMRAGAPATMLVDEFHLIDAKYQPVLIVKVKSFGTHRFEVVRPWRGLVGEIVQDNVLGRARLSLRVGSQRVAKVNRKGRRSLDFDIVDESGTEIARVTKRSERIQTVPDLTGKRVVLRLEMDRRLPEPLACVVVATTLAADHVFSGESFD